MGKSNKHGLPISTKRVLAEIFLPLTECDIRLYSYAFLKTLYSNIYFMQKLKDAYGHYDNFSGKWITNILLKIADEKY